MGGDREDNNDDVNASAAADTNPREHDDSNTSNDDMNPTEDDNSLREGHNVNASDGSDTNPTEDDSANAIGPSQRSSPTPAYMHTQQILEPRNSLQ